MQRVVFQPILLIHASVVFLLFLIEHAHLRSWEEAGISEPRVLVQLIFFTDYTQ